MASDLDDRDYLRVDALRDKQRVERFRFLSQLTPEDGDPDEDENEDKDEDENEEE